QPLQDHLAHVIHAPGLGDIAAQQLGRAGVTLLLNRTKPANGEAKESLLASPQQPHLRRTAHYEPLPLPLPPPTLAPKVAVTSPLDDRPMLAVTFSPRLPVTSKVPRMNSPSKVTTFAA